MLYLMFMMVLAGTCDRAALFNDYMIAEKVVHVGMCRHPDVSTFT